MDERVRALLQNDVQEKPVGTRGLTPRTVVVSPGAPILTVGALGDTDPQGDDVCSGPRVGGRCAGSILAGPNGIADTRANNRETQVKLEDFVSSAFRNPQRNRAAGSATINSRHTRGSALDIDPRRMPIPGKTPQQLMCIVEAAGDTVVGERDSFTERGATLFLACDSPSADHVHVQR
ncbi:D-Ala-D-Ala carboxypeptidase family metallohydrolase [Archangium gephyra]|nr:D-Ala-D-Ala carboxypeptidase family metallohydrolase [Archangium gephyra]